MLILGMCPYSAGLCSAVTMGNSAPEDKQVAEVAVTLLVLCVEA